MTENSERVLYEQTALGNPQGEPPANNVAQLLFASCALLFAAAWLAQKYRCVLIVVIAAVATFPTSSDLLPSLPLPHRLVYHGNVLRRLHRIKGFFLLQAVRHFSQGMRASVPQPRARWSVTLANI